MIVSLAVFAVCVAVVVAVFRYGPAVVERHERLAEWDDRLRPDTVRFPSEAARAARVAPLPPGGGSAARGAAGGPTAAAPAAPHST